MEKFKLSSRDKNIIEKRLKNKYKKIGSDDVLLVRVYQLETTNKDMITTVTFTYDFMRIDAISFIYSNDKLVSVTGTDVSMKFIEEMKDLLKEI